MWGDRPRRAPSEGAKRHQGLALAAAQLFAVRAYHEETQGMRLVAQGAAKGASVVLASTEALVARLGCAGAEDLLLPVLT